jgi:general L-amino acid transport system permease protein
MKMSRAVLRERLPGYAGQALLLVAVAWLAWAGLANFVHNLGQLHIASGFRFLRVQAGFEIAQTLVPFGAGSTYLDAVVVATLNTLLVVGLAALAGTAIALVVAFGRLSEQPLVRGACTAWVEVFRNIPLLLQIFFWYFSAIALLPPVADSLQFGGALLNNRGLFLPRLHFAAGALALELPVAEGFNVSGGVALLPELLALTLGLAIYNSAFLAEIFRAGIRAVPRGQSEAAAAVGLSGPRAALLVILPQALRLALPPAAGQYQALAKASSLAAAIGYPDIMQIVGGTILSQTSQALEAMALVVTLYAAINLLIALGVSLANRRLLRREAR